MQLKQGGDDEIHLMTDDGGLDQDCPFLLDADGKKIPSSDFFAYWERAWRPAQFTNLGRTLYNLLNAKATIAVYGKIRRDVLSRNPYFLLCARNDCEWYHFGDRKKFESLLSLRNVNIEQLFPWPVYPHGEDKYLTTYKKPHLFHYDGNVWHHLRKYTSPNEIMCAYGDTWIYTSVQSFEKALRKARPKEFRRHEELVRKGQERVCLGGPLVESCTFKISGMYEVFIDSEDVKKTH